MKPKNRIPKQSPRLAPITVEDFAAMDQQEPLVEHLTIAGFLRRVPHKWCIPEITKFGDQVGRTAEALHLAYLTAVDKSLGVTRIFPLPLLHRVYTVLSPQFGWPAMEKGLPAPENNAGRASERARKNLRELAENASDPNVKAALDVVINWLEHEAVVEKAEASPLRAL